MTTLIPIFRYVDGFVQCGHWISKIPMRHFSFYFGAFVLFSFGATAACGGQIVDDQKGNPTSSIPSSSSEVSVEETEEQPPPGPSDGAWGTWQLLSTETADGRDYNPPFIEIDIHPDGKVFRWSCATGGTGEGSRCPTNARVGCMVGTTQLEGLEWRVQLTNKEGSAVVGSGTIEEEASGDITLNGNGVLTPHAHYRRVGASDSGCIP